MMSVRSSSQAPIKRMRMNEDERAEFINQPSPTESSNASKRKLSQAHQAKERRVVQHRSIPSQAGTIYPVHPRCASLDPPISKATLNELDLDSLANNLLLRHDLNFDPRIQYQPNIDHLGGQRRISEALQYWSAVRAELSGCVRDQRYPTTSTLSSSGCGTILRSPLQSKSPHLTGLVRLPRIFENVREILKGLLPSEEWSAIDARLDVVLLVQELENAAFDFTSLGDWLCTLLQRFCLPERKPLIESLILAVHAGIQTKDPNHIICALQQIFRLFEILKLDFANQNIKTLRLAMVDCTVAFEQKEFLHRIAGGWDVDRARAWFTNERRRSESISGFQTLNTSITAMIIANCDNLPPTFTLDYIRIRTLQIRFEHLMYQTSCRWAFEEVLDSLGWHRPIPQEAYDNIFFRTSVIISDEEPEYNPSRRAEDILLEIVREAYRLCNIHKLPTTEDMETAESNLAHVANPTTSVSEELRLYIAEDLRKVAIEEFEQAKNLTPLGLANRYAPDGPTASRPVMITEKAELLRLAQQIAHISVLHWQVWAPILYELPDELGNT